MKIAAFRHNGKKFLGRVEGQWARPFAGVSDFMDFLRQGCSREESEIPLDEIEFLPPVENPGKIICVGRNYPEHAAEQGAQIPDHPIIFSKFASALCGHRGYILKPPETEKLDFEAELAVVIGKGGKNIKAESYFEHVAGYMNFNDVSARDVQAADKQWTRAKSFDTFAPCGPFLVTKDEIDDPHNLHIRSFLNCNPMQDSRTSLMLFKIPVLIEFISRAITLEAGDIIATGTPAGVGVFRDPPVFMQPGDVIEVEIEGLGRLRNRIR
ncbi:MAG: fumarylacetoacetate hydrolase family protein [Deltaproteobacteria bacterium]|nr:fumarylacetoacetate hydrolase family protein [Deltaproteobacteria bacterium]